MAAKSADETTFPSVSSKQLTANSMSEEGELLLTKNKELDEELNILKEKLNADKQKLQTETLKGADSENRLQMLKEELLLKQQKFKKALNEDRVMKQYGLIVLATRHMQIYSQKLTKSLDELNQIYADDTRVCQQRIAALYNDKVDWKNYNDFQRRSESLETMSRMTSIMSTINELENERVSFQTKITDYMNAMDEEGKLYMATLESQTDLIRKLEDENALLKKD